MTYLLAEDEQPQREACERLLAELWPEARCVASCADGLTALAACERLRPTVAFLDLRMPGLGGMEVAKASRVPLVVFITAYDDGAVAAFEQGAVDYVLKPVRRDRLARVIARLAARLGAPHATAPIAPRSVAEDDAIAGDAMRVGPPADAATAAKEPLQWLTASSGDIVRLYPIKDVLAFHAQDKYTRVLTANDEAIIRTSLRELVRRLDPSVFWQVHRSVVVRGLAIEFVTRDEANKHWLKLRGVDERLPIASAFHRAFRAM